MGSMEYGTSFQLSMFEVLWIIHNSGNIDVVWYYIFMHTFVYEFNQMDWRMFIKMLLENFIRNSNLLSWFHCKLQTQMKEIQQYKILNALLKAVFDPIHRFYSDYCYCRLWYFRLCIDNSLFRLFWSNICNRNR